MPEAARRQRKGSPETAQRQRRGSPETAQRQRRDSSGAALSRGTPFVRHTPPYVDLTIIPIASLGQHGSAARPYGQLLVSAGFTVLIIFALIDEAFIRWTRYRDDGARKAAEPRVAHDEGGHTVPHDRAADAAGPTHPIARPPPPPTAYKTTPERASNDVGYYAARYGYLCQRHRAVTKDGFSLELHRITRADVASRGRAVVLQHGLFMGGGIFVTNEEDSLAFILADLGYALVRACDFWAAQ